MTREEQIREAAYSRYCNDSSVTFGLQCNCFEEGAKWADKQMMELWNVTRNVYEAWMGGTMNDVRECMKDLGHVYDEFKDKGMY